MTALIFGFGAFFTYQLATFAYVVAQAFVGSAGGIRVQVISVGFGPVLFRSKFCGWDLYISACPWGGYTKFQGMDSDDSDNEAGSYQLASPWTRMATLTVGPLTNLLAGLVCLAVPVWTGAEQMIVTSPAVSMVQPCGVGGLAFQREPSTWPSQFKLADQTAGEYARRVVMFESLDGWGGPVGFMVTSGAIAKVSVAGWLTAQGIMLLAVSLANLLPIPVLNGFQIILVVFEMLFRTKPSERIVVNLTYAGLLVCLVVFGRILFVDFIWVIRALW